MAAEQAEPRLRHYLAVGCVTGVAGFFGGAMLGVMAAKITGAFTRCSPEAETGAPCNWLVFAAAGALIGLLVLPALALVRLRGARDGGGGGQGGGARDAADHSERG